MGIRGLSGRWAALRDRLLRRAVAVRDNARQDDGFTLSELLVAIFIMAIVGTIAVATYTSLNKNTTHGVTRTDAHQAQLDADLLLQRDVNEGITLHAATATELKVDVVRNGTCWGQGYTIADGTLKLSTTYFESADCNGASVTKSKTLVENLTSGAGFGYYAKQSGVAIPAGALTDLTDIGEVAWNLAVQPAGFDTPIGFNSRGRWSGFADATGSGKAVQQATAPILAVTAGAAEGKSAPVLTWSDTNPAGYVASWVLLRSANPEGDSSADPTRATWQQVGPSFPAGITTFTDASLPAGYTGQYIVRPTLSDGTLGPTSNQVVTGLRPVAISTLVVTGGNTSIKLAWTNPSGTTAVDVYRDGLLIANLDNVTTFTDGPGKPGWVNNPTDTSNGSVGSGYGHTHNYAVVAVNRWENLVITGAQNLRVAIGDQVTKAYNGTTRLASNQDGAFTTPAPPTLTVVANTTWGFNLTWTPSQPIGAGPTSKAGDGAAIVAWNTDRDPGPNSTPSGAWVSLFTGRAASQPTYTDTPGEGADASQWRHYRAASCNTWGCSPVSVAVGALQRPSAPVSCTAAKTGVTTRQMFVTISPAAATIANSGYRLTGGSPAPSGTVTGTGDQASATFNLDHLAHGTDHTFTSYSRNASTANGGYSDATSCSGATDTLTINAPSAWSVTTRSFSAGFSYGNGTAQSITANGQTIGGSSGSWDLLSDNTTWTVTGINSDGDNQVQAAANVGTPLLRNPTCSVSGGGTAPSGSITVSASGSNGTSQVAALGSGWYGSPHSWGISTAGTYTGTASATDGWNRSGSVNCGSVTVSPASIGDSGPGYSSSDECNGKVGSAAPTLSDELASLGASIGNPIPGPSGLILGNPLTASVSTADVHQYGATKSGSLAGGNLGCTFYRGYSTTDAFGDPQPTIYWISVGWSQGGGAV